MREPSQIWIVVPAYQAAGTIHAVIARIPERLKEESVVLVVDDGSTDTTSEVARCAGAQVMRNDRNIGYAPTQKRAFDHALAAGAQFVVLLHADGQYPPESLPDVLEPLLSDQADVVLGSRMLDGGALRRGMPLYKWMANRVLSFIENQCYRMHLSEYHTGMMAYSRRALEVLPFAAVSDTFHFDGEMAMLAGRRGLRVFEVPIPHVYRDEKSYLKPIPYGLTVLVIAFAVPLGLYDRWLVRRMRDRHSATISAHVE